MPPPGADPEGVDEAIAPVLVNVSLFGILLLVLEKRVGTIVPVVAGALGGFRPAAFPATESTFP